MISARTSRTIAVIASLPRTLTTSFWVTKASARSSGRLLSTTRRVLSQNTPARVIARKDDPASPVLVDDLVGHWLIVN